LRFIAWQEVTDAFVKMREEMQANEDRLLALITEREEQEATKRLGENFERLDALCLQIETCSKEISEFMEQGKWVRIAGKGQEMEANKDEMKKMHKRSLDLAWEVDGKVVLVSEPHVELVTKSGKRDFLFPGQQQPGSPEEAPMMDQLLKGEMPSYLSEAPDITTVKKAELSLEEVKLRQALYGSGDASSSPATAPVTLNGSPSKGIARSPNKLPQLGRPGATLGRPGLGL